MQTTVATLRSLNRAFCSLLFDDIIILECFLQHAHWPSTQASPEHWPRTQAFNSLAGIGGLPTQDSVRGATNNSKCAAVYAAATASAAVTGHVNLPRNSVRQPTHPTRDGCW